MVVSGVRDVVMIFRCILYVWAIGGKVFWQHCLFEMGLVVKIFLAVLTWDNSSTTGTAIVAHATTLRNSMINCLSAFVCF